MKTITWFLSVSSLFSCFVMADVSVQINSKQFKFDTPPRLTDVLALTAEHKSYIQANRLYRLDSEVPELLRQSILQSLTQLGTEWQNDKKKNDAVMALLQQLKSWRLAERIPVTLDYDLVRVKPEFNPKLDDNAQYLLVTQNRPDVVYSFGLINTASALTHQGAEDVTGYLGELHFNELSDKERVIILQNNNEIDEAGIAYFNKKHVEISPGGQIFIPFKAELLSSRLDRLNQQIIELASHRILP